MNTPLEVDEQLALAQYLDTRDDLLWFHPANERKCSPREGARLKRLGVKPGVPDVLIFDTCFIADESNPDWGQVLRGVAIELKRSKNGRTAVAQMRWLMELDKRGWYCAVCNGAEEAIATIERLYPR